jgi:hypothetical protein
MQDPGFAKAYGEIQPEMEAIRVMTENAEKKTDPRQNPATEGRCRRCRS